VTPPSPPLLLLVDLQRDYLASPGLEPAPGAVVNRARALLDGFRDRGLPVIHAWTTVTREDDRRMRHWKRDGLWRCEAGTAGHRPPPGLEPRPAEAIVHKTGFDPFASGELDRLLGDLGIERLVIAGIHLHACVREAVLGAHEREQIAEIWVADDAVTSDDPVHAAITRRYLERRAVRFLSVADVLASLPAPAPAGRRCAREPDGAYGPDDVYEPGDARGSGDARGPGDARGRVRETVAGCRGATAPWQSVCAADRARVLERAADLLEPQADSLAEAMAVEIGKPVRYGVGEVTRAAQMLRTIARRCVAMPEREPAADAELRRRPLGVVAVITPWNNPVYIPLGKIAAALAYGNAVLWKPAPAAQAIAERLAALLLSAGLPEGLLGLVAGARREAQLVMSDPDVDAVTVTGSSLAGFAAQEICARRRIPLQAELGGNNAALVWADADLEHAAREIAAGAFALAGQRCTANRRVVVERTRHDELLDLLVRETAALQWGDPRDPATHVGPLLGREQRDRLAELVARAERPSIVPHGRTAVEGLEAPWYPPTIVCCDEPAHELVQRETFGPVLVVQRAEDWVDAVALVNGVDQGLVAALFSRSPARATRFLEEADAGILKLNRSTADAEVDVPFGGWKASAVGPPEHGDFDRDFYTRPQTVYR
jgi:acyl-CoA reductase-like NAD-dependent aldehyde dehydrogenase/nicotinamidase-related amidase